MGGEISLRDPQVLPAERQRGDHLPVESELSAGRMLGSVSGAAELTAELAA